MTDNEIVKALELCCDDSFRCNECPYHSFTFSECDEIIRRAALDLINRQQAKIVRLETENNQFADIGKMYSEIKAEAINEFAERLKENLIEESYDDVQFFKVVGESDINNLVKEMVGDEE